MPSVGNQILISKERDPFSRNQHLALYDPDEPELQEYEGIDIFVPGSIIEREIDRPNMIHVLVMTGLALGASAVLGLIIAFPLIAVGLIREIPVAPFIFFEPYAFLILTLAEIGFVIPPIWYIRRRGYSFSALGVKKMASGKEIGLGLLVGLAMLGANLGISFLISYAFEIPEGDGFLIPYASSEFELVLWIVVMFAIVGFSEELLFRGFLQRRMEMYFKTRNSSPELYALVITSFIFAAIHLDVIGIPTRFALGLFLGHLAQRRNYSIAGPTVAHGLNNAVVVLLTFLGI